MGGGFPVVLTADRTLMADYRLLFDGMLAASQTTTAPPSLLGPLLMPRPAHDAPRAAVAPLGLRRIEAALLEGGFRSEDVIVADDRCLGDVIGPATRIVGISSGEPTGQGMNTSTMTAIAGGRIYPQAMFLTLLDKVHRAVGRSGAKPRLVLGGPGAWQLAADAAARVRLGIDHVLCGYAEGNVASVFRQIMQGGTVCEVIDGQRPEMVPAIRSATTMGIVEMSRGCGLGCSFCTVARVPMIHLPPHTILSDVRTNVDAGRTSIAALSEDFFRYGATGLKVEPQRLIELLTAMREIAPLNLIQIDHANVISIAQYSDEQLCTIRRLLAGSSGVEYLWVNVGVESASGQLLKDGGSAGKLGRGDPADWGELCAQQLRRLSRCGFFPLASLIMGLPGETPQHIQQTLQWVQSLAEDRIAIFPMLHAPIDGAAAPWREQLHSGHWELIRRCYRLNFRWVPRMYWDNQKAAGVPWIKRVGLQAMGLGQVLQWKALFAWHARKAKAWQG